jgi:hypothetical protein
MDETGREYREKRDFIRLGVEADVPMIHAVDV